MMSNNQIPKMCGLCGRWGVRGFRESYSSDGVNTAQAPWVCNNDSACLARKVKPFEQVLKQTMSR